MTNISKQFTADVVLPDGSCASNVQDIDRYLRKNGLAHASDYSPEYINNIRQNKEKEQLSETKAAFIRNYKREIWK